jgi:hypothetical protein
MIGITEFYKKVLPSQGVYCVADINLSKSISLKYLESIDEIETAIKIIAATRKTNIFVALSTFSKHQRRQEYAIYSKSFYLDIDVGPDKNYPTKQAAIDAINKFVADTGLPNPTLLDSGTGIWAYWIFDTDIPINEWVAYATKFKQFCISHGFSFDEQVAAESARIARAPNTLNYKTDPPSPTKVISDTIELYNFQEFKQFLGEVEVIESIEDIFKKAKKGLTEDDKAVRGLDNWEYSFDKLLNESIEGKACNQIKFMYEKPADISYNLWTAGLTVAIRCEEGEDAVDRLSKNYPNYNREEAIYKAKDFDSVHSCDKFFEANPAGCEGCPHRGKVTNPLMLARRFREVDIPVISTPEPEVMTALEVLQEDPGEWEEREPGPVFTQEAPNVIANINIFYIPDELRPFKHGATGGIYKELPNKVNTKTGVVEHQEPKLVTLYNVMPTRRLWNTIEGYSMEIRVFYPKDEPATFLFPMKYILSETKIGEFFGNRGINIERGALHDFMDYLNRWGTFLSFKGRADLIKTQMGWSDDARTSFTIGTKEYRRDGSIVEFPLSALTENAASFLVQKGSFEKWKFAAEQLNTDGLEVHAFCMLAGFASALMNYSNTPGATISLSGASGGAKSGALFSAFSIWGNPEQMYFHTTTTYTTNAFRGRMLTMHNLPIGIDEITNIEPTPLSETIHMVSAGKPKAKMQGSINAERAIEQSASLIAFMTTNQANYAKLSVHKHDPNGEVARLIEFELGQAKPLNDDANFATRVFETLKHNYGWAGPKFIQAIMDIENKGEILRHYEGDHNFGPRIQKWVDRFRTDYGFNAANRFYTNIVGLTCFSGDVCNEYNIANLNVEKIYKHIAGEMVRIREEVIQINTLDYEGLISGYLNQYLSTNTLVVKGGIATLEPRGALIVRDDVDEGIIYISRSIFNTYLTSELKINPQTFKSKLKDSNIEHGEKRMRMSQGWKNASSSEFNIWTYWFKLTKKHTDE